MLITLDVYLRITQCSQFLPETEAVFVDSTLDVYRRITECSQFLPHQTETIFVGNTLAFHTPSKVALRDYSPNYATNWILL